MSRSKILVIVGPTASGKTEWAIKLARKFKGEIINADSRQIYKAMNIGTAKPLDPPGRGPIRKADLGPKTQEEYFYKGVRHYLIDLLKPTKDFNVAKYKRLAIKTIRAILKRKKLPILVGGTGLYIKAVIDNLKIPPTQPQPKLRQQLEKQLRQKGLKSLYEKLIRLDPEAAYIVDPNNPRRIIRALEITLTTKKPFSTQRKGGQKLFDTLELGINNSKERLFQKIEQRVDKMMQNGLFEEVKILVKKYGPNCLAFDAIGYRELIEYLNNKTTLKKAVELIKKNTRQYARRQMTWFKKDKKIHWVKSVKEAIKLTEVFLEN